MFTKLSHKLLFGLLLTTIMSFVQNQSTGIKLTITHLRNNKGHVLVAVYKDGIGYPDEVEKAFKRARLSISNKTTSILFNDLPSGNYAIAILHDENDDYKMNKNFFGIPKEGYGFSNNVMGIFGPPSHSKASFQYTGKERMELIIDTRY